MRGRAAALAALLSLVLPAHATAQLRAEPERRLRPEGRGDLILDGDATLHAGLGLETSVSTYARVAGVIAAGTRLESGGPELSTRADAIVRFVLDPLVQLTRAPYVAGGVSVRRDVGVTRAVLVAALGLQLRRRGRYVPAVELGFGQGVRLGVVVR